MKASIIIIGDELLIGQVTDTNSGFLARSMAPYGWEVSNVRTIADDPNAIREAVRDALEESRVVLTTGGLGPTKDDITKSVLCEIFGGELREDPSVTENIKNVFRKRGIKLNELTAAQAWVPTSASVIQNPVGTAPVMWFETEGPRESVLVAMPGVPFETEHVFTNAVLPRLLSRFPSPDVIVHRTIMVSDISESALAMRLSDWESALPSHLHLAYLPKPGLIRLRLDGHGHDEEQLKEEIDRETAKLIALLGDNFLYDGDATPAEILLRTLKAAGLTFATAESCTGGNIAHLITSVAGSSESMLGGVVSYSNDVKKKLLGVKAETLEALGAVSIPVVEQMAEGACRATGADVAVATSGIAGPGGGTEQKPVGTVCIAATFRGQTVSDTFHFPGNRARVIDRASTTALLLAIHLIRKANPSITKQ